MAVNLKCPWTGKDVFFTQAAVDRAVETYRRKRDLELRAYQCPQCKHYHLTKQRAKSAATMFAEVLK